MAITEINRARIILDLIKDGVVANETPYSSLDLATAALATKYGTALWNVEGPDLNANGTPILNPTNVQLANFFIKKLRTYLKRILEQSRAPVAAKTALDAEKNAIATEITSDLGT